MKIQFYKLGKVQLPNKAHNEDAGIDFYIPSYSEQFIDELKKINHFNTNIIINETYFQISSTLKSILIPSLLKVKIPKNYCIVFFNKSSIATKFHYQIGACVIDENYTDQFYYHLFLLNNSKPKRFYYDTKIVQGLLIEVPKIEIEEIYEYNYQTERKGGFGSTDLKLKELLKE